jgi:bifunctional ADP-heptose synthase (sugar kinase/adenylyltransferase)
VDTRTKIVPSFESTELPTVVGYFDPMHAGHVRRLREICADGHRIAVVIADPPDPILPTRARAELVAALDCVEYVVAAGTNADAITAARPNVLDERTADIERSRLFAQHVLARHNAQ